MEIDKQTRAIIASFLKGLKTKKISKAKMEELKEEILKKTEIRMLNISTLKRMIKKVAKEIAQAEKIEEAKIESISGFKPVIVPLTTQAFQNMVIYDLSASKKTLERLNERLESIKEASKSVEFKNKISSEVALIRKEIEKLSNKLENVERLLIQKTGKK